MPSHAHTHHAAQGPEAGAESVAEPLMLPPAQEMLARLEQRRSAPLRGLAEPGPTREELVRLVALAARVPDHGRLAPWRFILIEGDARQALGAQLDALYARQNPELPAAKADMWTLYLSRAPLTVVLVSRPDAGAKVPEWNQVLSAGAAGMALTVAATALGFATQWLLKWPGRDPEAAALVGITPGERIAGFIHVGRPVRLGEDRPRPALEQVASFWTPATVVPASGVNDQPSTSKETP
ncbi:nitroreductase family protein [Ancylobacter amanitiformis]|uniref:Nitroreductase n=1 Tax=Ancylobacter amanitiformis TaxID=217069 RepID=A0ABU0LQ36_9HYPH|nr:nitroreductase [Ancylobacter amanitiformis]MDQ0510806.1 nitroreductase [Ancylobacter amanitiformis]